MGMTALVGVASAWHAQGYLAGECEKRLRFFWLFFNLTLTSMLLIPQVSGALPFLVVWELMGLASFALVAFEYHEKAVRDASWIYLLACEAGGLLLMLGLFSGLDSCCPGAIPYVLLIGFGLKAGFPLLHFWLPEAHPAAPAPVSAIMSAAMIPLGFYGIFSFVEPMGRTFGFGMVMLFLGIFGAFFGILSGMSCQNIKRLLAYSSVENIGIASMGFGLFILGENAGLEMMSTCGLAGALLHLLNHSLLKGSLFLGAGSVLKSTGTLNMDRLGGLLKKMPWTGGCFIASSLGICGLPPFCGFAGELLIYVAAFLGISQGTSSVFAVSLLAAIALALTGAVACAAFSKTISAVFLGEPRYEEGRDAQPEQRQMAGPIVLLSSLAILMTFAAPLLVPSVSGILGKYALLAGLSYLLAGVMIFLRFKRGTDVRSNLGTWDCGYARPTARMQYTGSAFVQPLADLFNCFLQQKKEIVKPEGYFPKQASFLAACQDFSLRFIYQPLASALRRGALVIHRLQSGYVHLYILILVVALALLLLYGFHGEIMAGGK